MKKKLIAAALIVLCLTIGIGGSAAYFVGEDVAHNVITTGSVKADLLEWADMDGTPFEDVDGVMPGDEVPKIVLAENTGDNAAWMRIRVEKAVTLAGDGEADSDLVSLDINTTDWTEQDGWYYYNTPVAPGGKTAPLFTTVSFDESMENIWQAATVTVDVMLQAVQWANNGDTVLDAVGWPDSYDASKGGRTP